MLAAGWSGSVFLMYVCLYGAMGITSTRHQYDLWESSVYAGFHRLGWAVAVAWIVCACQMGYGGKRYFIYHVGVVIWKTKTSATVYKLTGSRRAIFHAYSFAASVTFEALPGGSIGVATGTEHRVSSSVSSSKLKLITRRLTQRDYDVAPVI